MDLEYSQKVCVLKAYSWLRVLLGVEDPLRSGLGGEVEERLDFRSGEGRGGAYGP